jgi:hypothetical protein
MPMADAHAADGTFDDKHDTLRWPLTTTMNE